MRFSPTLIGLIALGAALFAALGAALAAGDETPVARTYATAPPAPVRQSPDEAARKSGGCVSCHQPMDLTSMHESPAVHLGCVDCHGGDAGIVKPAGSTYVPAAVHGSHGQAKAEGAEEGAKADPAYVAARNAAHVLPRYPKSWRWPSAANPVRSYTLLNREAPEYIRFVNPSDYRVAREACGACHMDVIVAAERSLMATSAMLWGGAAYNNGILPYKRYILGEGYTRDGKAATLVNPVLPDARMEARGILPSLVPLPAWETVPPGDNFRVFEDGGRNIGTQFPEIGLPNALGQIQRVEEPGRPDIRQSNRGPGTGLRIAVPLINIHKTRLNDPNMWFIGTNDQPGDYRASGCASCHVVYANDRDPAHSGPYAAFGHRGKSQSADPTISKTEEGHPLRHAFTRAIPTSQCMVCHMHQPNIFVNSYLGYTMWDYESDAGAMWPEKQRYPTDSEMMETLSRNPEEAAVRGKWSDREFLDRVSELNPKLKDTQFADYHGHGWNFRAVMKRDRKGNLLDAEGKIVSSDDPEKFAKAVHLKDIHLERGMHCVDCHFAQDGHGNGHIYGEVADAIEIGCKDCHGTAQSLPTLRTSGPAARPGGFDLGRLRTPDGRARFEWRGDQLYQRASLDPKLEWRVSLVKHSVTPGDADYNSRAARAKLMSKDPSMKWGPGVAPASLAHKDDEMACYTCHVSWTTSCNGCHLPIQANWKTPRHHYEGGETRNYATYNPQVARDDIFQLGVHSTVKGNIVAPVRSSSALVLSSTNINRERLYIQQPPVSSPGFSSQAFAPHFPHTVRKTETKTCSDCHLSKKGDNNAIMAQLLLQGTNFVNFVGFNAWIGGGGGVQAVQVTEWDEPQAVIGSFLHKHAYPDYYARHLERGRELPETPGGGTFAHAGGTTRCLQLRGEYLFAAEGDRGMRVYDVASIANKGVSQRIVTAPFSPLGHDTHIASRNATCVVLPTNQPIAPARNEGDLMRKTNEEQPFSPVYRYAYVTDAEEGLVVVDVGTMEDRDARNNFLKRALTWNEGGILAGARHLAIAGTDFYVAADRGIVVLDMADPLRPRVKATIDLPGVTSAAVQFRYLFATTARGLEVVDVTRPDRPRLVPGAIVPLGDARRVYVARTFAYVAAGRDGLAMIDIERPEKPVLHQTFDADGQMNDASDVVVGTTNASAYAYVADGRNGLKVVSLTAPDRQPNFYGFSPDPKPLLVAWSKTPYPALSLSKGLDRDRAVDETGGQIAVMGRLGSRPFSAEEMRRFYLREDGTPWTVEDDVVMDDFLARSADLDGPAPGDAGAATQRRVGGSVRRADH